MAINHMNAGISAEVTLSPYTYIYTIIITTTMVMVVRWLSVGQMTWLLSRAF